MAPRPIASSDKPLLINGFFWWSERMTKSQNSCDQMRKCRGEGAKKSRNELTDTYTHRSGPLCQNLLLQNACFRLSLFRRPLSNGCRYTSQIFYEDTARTIAFCRSARAVTRGNRERDSARTRIRKSATADALHSPNSP